jgi:hypothetical protein
MIAARKAKAAVRLAIVRRVAAEDGTKEEAARRAGLSIGGLNTMLHRRLGSTTWPPAP